MKYWAVIPAAGVGKRMGKPIPKQYLKIRDKTILQHTLERFFSHPTVSGTVLVLGKDDEWWPSVEQQLAPEILESLTVVTGGEERFHSVLNGLISLAEKLGDEQDDWVLVHDAARPCVTHDDISALIDTVGSNQNGGLLACRVRDTMKRGESIDTVQSTIDRNNLWHALTPQLFPLKNLKDSLLDVKDNPEQITDESSAMELAGYHPLLVEGSASNLKITLAEDLALVSFYLDQQSINT